MIEHCKLARLRHEEIDPSMNDMQLKVASRREMTQEWLSDCLPTLGYDTRGVQACSFSAEILKIVSRCWAYRNLASFASLCDEVETMEAWNGMDADSSAIDVEKPPFSIDWKVCLKDRDGFPACAEIMAVVANWVIDEINVMSSWKKVSCCDDRDRENYKQSRR